MSTHSYHYSPLTVPSNHNSTRCSPPSSPCATYATNHNNRCLPTNSTSPLLSTPSTPLFSAPHSHPTSVFFTSSNLPFSPISVRPPPFLQPSRVHHHHHSQILQPRSNTTTPPSNAPILSHQLFSPLPPTVITTHLLLPSSLTQHIHHPTTDLQSTTKPPHLRSVDLIPAPLPPPYSPLNTIHPLLTFNPLLISIRTISQPSYLLIHHQSSVM